MVKCNSLTVASPVRSWYTLRMTEKQLNQLKWALIVMSVGTILLVLVVVANPSFFLM